MITIHIPVCETYSDADQYYTARQILTLHGVIASPDDEVMEDGWFDAAPDVANAVVAELAAAGIEATLESE